MSHYIFAVRYHRISSKLIDMAVSFRYWDDCVAPQDLETMWKDPDVKNEWINAGEDKESKVHLSRDPDGHPFLTQIEMKVDVLHL